MKEETKKNTEASSDATADTANALDIEKLMAERDEYLAGWQRAKADFANAKKRMEETMVEFRSMANEGLIEELLPVLSSFEMAFANKAAWEKDDKNWRMGVEHIYSQMKGVLAANGLKEIDPVGQRFDHNLHEAVRHDPVDDASKSDAVLSVVEKGYMLGTKLIRPAKVVVGEFAEKK